MRGLVLALLAGVAPLPALAQYAGHDAHAHHAEPAPTDPHAGHTAHTGHASHTGHGTTSAPAAEPHAGHVMAEPATPDPHAGHIMPEGSPSPAAPDPHAGHAGAATPADPHAGHGAPPAAANIPAGPPPAAALSSPVHAADRLFGTPAMAAARAAVQREHGDSRLARVMVDRLEAGFGRGHDSYAWEGHAWTGNDIDKVWLTTEGEGEFGGALESAEVQVLWGHAIDPWFDLRAGVRQDFRPGPRRTHLALGIQGLAPYWIEVDASLFLSHKGDVTARVEAEHDIRLTQQLILQPRVEADFSFQDSAALGVGSGLSTVEASLRLRHEFRPQTGPAVIAPYVGLVHERAFGNTVDYRRAAGEKRSGWRGLVGLHTWF